MRGGLVGVAGATASSAVLTYLLYGAAVTAAPAAEADAFTTFWYGSLVVSLGVFVPLEQVVARALSHRSGTGGTRALVPATCRAAAALLAVAVLGVVLAGPLLQAAAGPRGGWVAAALVAVAVVGSLQFAVRGVALGSGRLRGYAAALFGESLLRATAALLVAVLVVPPPGVAFAACVVGSALLAHVALLAGLRRVSVPGAPREVAAAVGLTPEPAAPASAAPAGGVSVGAVLTLLGASLSAQVLLNAGPLLVGLAGGPAGTVAAYGATFTLARAPLFVLVPVQAALVPPLVRMVAEGHRRELTRWAAGVSCAVAGVAALGAGLGALLAGPATRVLTGGSVEAAPALMALLVAGCVLHAGLVVGTQALVATGRERWVLACWLVALAVAGLVLWSPAGGWGVGWAFTSGSAAGWALSVVVLVRRRRSRVDATG